MVYATYKGLKNAEIAQILDTSAASVGGKKNQVKHPELCSKSIQKKIDRAIVLEFKVRSGEYKDHQSVWNEKITRINGIRYAVEQPKEEIPVAVEEVIADEKVTILEVSVNMSGIKRILSSIKGAL